MGVPEEEAFPTKGAVSITAMAERWEEKNDRKEVRIRWP